MTRKILMLTAFVAAAAVATPAMAWAGWPGGRPPGTSTSSSGGATSSGGSHSVPEPGMLGLMGAGLIGLGLARRRKKAQD